ncbi:MAG TPA: hypothetical protein VGS20_17540 [Candidatus Acidoferrales bacterium]|nr:hypothetical protein [Candidatus Acidoferrales bacterium]
MTPRAIPRTKSARQLAVSRSLLATVAAIVAFFAAPRPALAVPSFARQTGLACSSCHLNPPELTPLGRRFKLNGYTMTGLKVISAPPQKGTPGLALLSYLPLAAMFEVSDTGLNRPEPTTQNWDFAIPQDVSLFLAGAFATHAGGFVQATYNSQSDHFSWDNTDIRYAKNTLLRGKTLVYGAMLNNNPTVEDLWHDTPAWGFPWINSSSVPTPAAAAAVDGRLAQDVAGLGGYAMWNDHLYGAATIYRSAHLGQPLPNTGVGFDFNIQGAAPYWRAAWQQTMGNNYLEVGTYGMHIRSTPQAIAGPENTYTDVAVDSQFERVLPTLANDLLIFHATYIHEHSDLNGFFAAGSAGVVPHNLNTFRVNAVYHFGYRYVSALGYFLTTGTADPVLYAPADLQGSRTGSPRNEGFVANFTYWPVQNVRMAVQYTGYTEFNGARFNYDGAGRNAGDNNSLYLYVGLFF